MSDVDFSTEPETIAIVGLAGRFPGAPDIDAFWQNVRNGVESVSFFSAEELIAAGVPAVLVEDPAYVRAKATLDDADKFDAEFFGYLPAEAEVMDPQHRAFLECAWTALEHAGYDPRQVPGLVGVFGGMSQATYLPLLKALDPDGLRYGGYPMRIGTDKDYLATRVAYKLNLRGLSMTVQTACSTSLVAICQACQALLGYQCDVALAGGVAISVPLKSGNLTQEGGIHSPDGHCRAFDARAEGIVSGEGVGIVVLKRLSEALADGDTIHAVIKGFGLTNDGSGKVGFTAPSPDGQAAAIGTALALAGVSPDTISYVEAHGTGTQLGDPIEIAGLTAAFRAGSDRTGYCAIGSVKTNIGHLDAAAGVTGLIKTVLALRHRELPPSLHFSTPNPAIDFSSTPFIVNASLRAWPASETPRRAGVSAFGLGGTNAHVVLEEAPPEASASVAAAPQVFVLSARSDASLARTVATSADYLETHAGLEPADVAWTLRHGRARFDHRAAVVGQNLAEAAEALRATNSPRHFAGRRGDKPPAVAFLFPGGGAQYPNMAVELYRHEPVFRDHVDRCLALLQAAHGVDLRPVLFPAPEHEAAARESIQRPLNSILSVFVIEYALAQWWMAHGVMPAAMTGHSLGEYTAACLAGVFSVEDAVAIVKARGDIFEKMPEGAMLSVPVSNELLRPFLHDELSLAAVNGPSLCVVSGPTAHIDTLEATLLDADIDATRLHISVAAHSTLLEPFLTEFAARLNTVTFSPPSRPFISNVTGTWATADEVSRPAYWLRHLRGTVQFSAGLSCLLQEPRVLLEVGPGNTLGAFARMHGALATIDPIASLRHPRDTTNDRAVLATAVARLWVAGVDVDWPAQSERRRRVPLPTYSFDRRRFWPSAVAAAPPAAEGLPRAVEPPIQLSQLTMTTPLPARARVDRIRGKLVEILHKLSGLPEHDIHPTIPFVQMGFDSLFLSQASLRFKAEFKVRITFRQLFEEAPTVHDLAAYIDAKLPKDAYPDPTPVAAPALVAAPVALVATAPSAAPPSPVAVAPVLGFGAPAADASAIERIVHDQLRVMGEQLRLLSGGVPLTTSVASSALTVPAPMVAAPALAATDAAVTTGPSQPVSAGGAAPTPQFGPFRGIDRAAHGLTPHQQRHLDALIARYTRRTQGSKQLTDAQRPHLADPRAVTGFRQSWKEMVYQIATTRSAGARVWDVDGNEYLDVSSSFGVNILGFSPASITTAIANQLTAGIELGTLSPLAREVADLLCELTGMERATFANTGSEAIAGAIRGVRTATGREWIAVFHEEYHGMAEEVLVKSVGAAGQRQSVSGAPGIPDHLVGKVLVLHYDDPNCLTILREHAEELAGVIIEPVQSRHPSLPSVDMLREIRRVTSECEIPLIFDEMITGFRLHQRGAVGFLGIEPDISCYGKIMSGGMPIAAIAGKARYLDAYDGGPWQFGDDSYPEGSVTFFGGTYTRNPLSLAGALAALRELKAAGPELQQRLNALGDHLAARLNELFRRYQAPMTIEHRGSIISVQYTTNNPLARLLTYYLRAAGIHVWDRPFFLTAAHTDADITRLIGAFDTALQEMAAAHFLGNDGPPTPPPGGHGVEIAPLTEAQKEIWLAGKMDDHAAVAYNEAIQLAVDGEFDLESFRRAVGVLMARHPVLAARISADGESQTIDPAASLEVALTDLGGEDDATRERRLAEAADREVSVPFDLERGPLARVEVVRLSATRHVILWTAHHIVCDGWSLWVIVEELAATYSALRRGVAPTLPAVGSFAAYAREHAGDSPELEESLAYWRRQFATLPAPLDLPSDRPLPAVRTARAATARWSVPGPLARVLRELAGQQNTTLVVLLLTAVKTLLYRLTGQADVVVGMGAAGQTQSVEVLVGHCLNLLPIRTVLEPDASFTANMALVRTRVLDAFDHQDATVGGIIRDLRVPRSSNRPPLVQVIFNYDRHQQRQPFDTLTTTIARTGKHALHYDLFFNITEGPSGLGGYCDYDTDLFDEATIARWFSHLEMFLQAVAADPAMAIGRAPLLTAAARHQTLVEWNATAVDYPLDRSLHELVEAQVARTPAAEAVRFDDESLSYQEFNARANRLARLLRERGVGPNVLVAVCAERSIELVVALHAIVKAGGAYVPIDPSYPAERLALLLNDIAPPLVLTQQRFLDRVPASFERLALDAPDHQLDDASAENLKRLTGPKDAAYVIYTSGSTGIPKGVVNIHEGIVNRLLWMQDAYRLTGGDRVLQKTPYTFDVSVWEFFWPLLTGACLVVAKPDGHKDPRYLGQLIARERITTLHFVPSMLDVFLDAIDREDLRSIRQVICSGEALGLDLQRRFFAMVHGAELHNLYGPTEAAIDVTYWACDRETTLNTVPIGRPIANTQIYLLDIGMAPVPIGVAGELFIGGIGVARGYLQRPELTAERFIDDPFSPVPGARLYRTGDSARFLPDGAIEYLGRLDNQVKIRGLRIELGEIEAVVRDLPEISQVAVTAREDAPGDKRLVAYLVTPTTDVAAVVSRVKEAIARQLPDYMMPSAFVRLPTLPFTTSGKLDRNALPAPDTADSTRTVVAPRTRVETQLAAIWTDLLRVDRLGVTDDFFELGGHSLLAMRAVSRIRDTFGVELSPRTFFSNATVAKLAAVIGDDASDSAAAPEAERSGQSPAADIIVAGVYDGLQPLSFAQERLWFIEHLAVGKAAYNISHAVELEGQVDPSAMTRTLAELLRRNGVLRSRFVDRDGQPFQEMLPTIELELAERDLSELSNEARQREWPRFRRSEGLRPFDLSRAPLVRATLVRLTARQHALLLVLHHIVADEWSLELIDREVRALYDAFRAQRPSPLPEPALQYVDYARWQRERLTEQVIEPKLAFWRAELAGAPAVLELPTDRPRPHTPSYRGETERFELPQRLVANLKTLTQQQHATLFMTCMAAFMTLLHRYTGQSDIVVGTPISGRTSSETEGLIGLFLNTVAVRGRFAEQPSFRHVVAQVRDSAISAYGHHDLPFERLVAELAHTRDLRYSPIFQVMFIWFDAAVQSQALQISGKQQQEIGTAKFDLTMLLSESDGRLRGTVEYSTDLFTAETIHRFVGHYGTLLESLLLHPDAPVTHAALLTSDERRQLRDDWNATTVRRADADTPLHELLAQQARRHPEREAVVCGSLSISYGDLDRRANQLAHRLRAAGVGPEIIVGIMLDRSIEMVVALHAILKCGGAYLPLDPNFPAERLAHMLADSGCGVMVTMDGVERILPVLPRVVARLDEEAEAIAALPSTPVEGVSVTGANRAYVLYTSGSTGRPKGVEVSHGALVNLLRSMQREAGFRADDRLLAVTTLSFDIAGLELHLPLLAGGTLIVATSDVVHDPARLIALMEQSACTVMQATPSLWRAVIDADWPGNPALRVLCGGEALTTDLAVELLPRCGELWNMYGPTETTIWSTGRRITDAASIDIGRPIDNTDVMILDAHQQLLPVHVPGELWIAGAGLARGYLGQPQLTGERFVAHPFSTGARMYRTGDRARWRSDGTIDVLGRLDHQVKIRGFRIEPGEIEAALVSHDAVRDAVVIARSDGPGGNALVAYVVAQPSAEVSDAALRDHVRRLLPEYMVPPAIIRLECVPLSPNGKIDRQALPAPALNDRAASAGDTPASPAEIKLAAIWQSVLGVPHVHSTDNFFELGGHSLLAMRLVHRVHREFGISMSPAALFLNPVLRDLARTIAPTVLLRQPALAPLSEETVVRLEAGGGGTPFFWTHGIGGEVFSYMHLSRHLGENRPVYGFAADWTTLHDDRPRTLEGMAARYVEEMRRIQPVGPYYLGGYCAASLLALEMTRQLEHAGESVGLLVAIDHEIESSPNTSGLRSAAAFLLNLPRWVKDDALASGGTDLMGRLLSRVRKVALAQRASADGAAVPATIDIRDRLGMWRFPDHQVPMLDLYARLLSEYQPQPVAAKIAVIMPRSARLLGPWPLGYDRTWDAMALGGVESYRVRGSHATMLIEPNAGELADTIEQCIDRVERERRGPTPRPMTNQVA